MKRAALFSFSDHGRAVADRIGDFLKQDYIPEFLQPKGNLKEVTGEQFQNCDVLIFVGSCGIAVRAIAPYVSSKTADPAVLVCDDAGKHVISLLSGHIGGANELTLKVAQAIGAEPVITTATDVNSRFSVDTWAVGQGLTIDSMPMAKRFSAKILQQELPFYSELPIDGTRPAGIFPASEGDFGAAVTWHEQGPFGENLLLVPKLLYLGIGCKRDTPRETIEERVRAVLRENDLNPAAVTAVASIDVKQNEAGLLAFAKANDYPISFYSAEELNSLTGDFSQSTFVKSTVGVDNVCERAAMYAAGETAQLLVRKNGGSGVTVAVAIKNRRLSF